VVPGSRYTGFTGHVSTREPSYCCRQ